MTCFPTRFPHINMERFLENSRQTPIVSTLVGVPEAAVTTLALAGVIPARIILEAAKMIPLPASLRGRVYALSENTITLSQSLLDRLARALVSSVPFVGSYIFRELHEAQRELEMVRRSASPGQIARLSERIRSLQENCERLSAEKAELLQATAEFSSAEESLKAAETHVQDLTRDLLQARKELSEMSAAVKGNTAALGSEKEMVAGLQERVAQGQAAVHALEEKEALASQAFAKQAEELRAARTTLEARISDYEATKAALDGATVELERIQGQLRTISEERDVAIQTAHTQEEALEVADQHISDLTEQVSSLQEQIAEKDRTIGSLRTLRQPPSRVKKQHQ